MMLKIWTKVPDFLSKSVLKKCSSSKSARDELGYALGSGRGGIALGETPKGAQLLADLHHLFNDTHKTRGKSSVHDMITLAPPMVAFEENLLRIYTSIPHSTLLPL
jgi:hypothetical protein